MLRRLSFFLLFLLIFSSSASAEPIVWEKWSDKVFERAARENKLVILDLEAVWCHWCHVMADTTYSDPEVTKLIHSGYIAVRVDQDADPDISVRYEEWGWPATVIFSPKGAELVKRRGYIPPKAMASLLDAVIHDPTPGPSVREEAETPPSESSLLTDAQKKKIEAEHVSLYDAENGGWGERLKLIDNGHLEWGIVRALEGDKAEAAKVQKTLDQALNLLDPVWGGFYQYSEESDWKSPHFEKIMSIQASYIKFYAEASLIWQKPAYAAAAEKTAGYVERFWTSSEGAFFTSQDADVDPSLKGKDFYSRDEAARLALGKAPRIDRHIYARENGWMISALATLYGATGEEKYLAQASKAAHWIAQNRALGSGGFRHDDEDRAGPYLGDTLSMGQAFLDLYQASGERSWLVSAETAADFLEKNFSDPAAGYITAKIPADSQGVFRKPVRQLEENVSAARFANLLFRVTGKTVYRDMAAHAMKYLASPAITGERRFLGGVLVADHEIGSEPAHLTIVGSKKDRRSGALFAQALRYPSAYHRIEWWDPSEGPLPNPDVAYPELEKPAAFLCANSACSTPMFTPENFRRSILSRFRLQ